MKAWSWFCGLLLSAMAVNVAGYFAGGLWAALCGLGAVVLSFLAVIALIALEKKEAGV